MDKLPGNVGKEQLVNLALLRLPCGPGQRLFYSHYQWSSAVPVGAQQVGKMAWLSHAPSREVGQQGSLFGAPQACLFPC